MTCRTDIDDVGQMRREVADNLGVGVRVRVRVRVRVS